MFFKGAKGVAREGLLPLGGALAYCKLVAFTRFFRLPPPFEMKCNYNVNTP